MHKRTLKWIVLAAAIAAPLAAQAHKMWLLPSATNVAGADPWVTVDAVISNDLFHPDHHAASLEQLVITAPDGQTAKPANEAVGKYRSVFDLQLNQQGTYKLALVSSGLSASYELDGQKKRWRGKADELRSAIPSAAKNVQVTASSNRVETFISNGKPNETALKPTGQGLELVPVTRVTDLVAGGFDAGIRLGECLARDMVALPIGPMQRQVVVGAPAYFARHPAPPTPGDLVGHQCIRYRRSNGRLMAWEFSRDGRDFEVEVDGRLVVNESGLALDLARAGLGMTQVFEAQVADDLASGRLQCALDDWQLPFPGFHVYYPAREHLPPKLRVFVEHLRAEA